jgi:hypothetical protein
MATSSKIEGVVERGSKGLHAAFAVVVGSPGESLAVTGGTRQAATMQDTAL